MSISVQCLSVNLRKMCYRKLSGRPRHHGQDREVIPTFKDVPAKLAEIEARLETGMP